MSYSIASTTEEASSKSREYDQSAGKTKSR
jgi:hypothetical protein